VWCILIDGYCRCELWEAEDENSKNKNDDEINEEGKRGSLFSVLMHMLFSRI